MLLCSWGLTKRSPDSQSGTVRRGRGRFWHDALVRCSRLQRAAPIGRLPFASLPLDPFSPSAVVPIGLSPPLTLLFLLGLTFPLYFPFPFLGLSLHRPWCPSVSHHSFPFRGGGGGVLGLQTPTQPKQMLTQNSTDQKSNLNKRSPMEPNQPPPPSPSDSIPYKRSVLPAEVWGMPCGHVLAVRHKSPSDVSLRTVDSGGQHEAPSCLRWPSLGLPTSTLHTPVGHQKRCCVGHLQRGNLCTVRALRATFRLCSPRRAPKQTPWKRP